MAQLRLSINSQDSSKLNSQYEHSYETEPDAAQGSEFCPYCKERYLKLQPQMNDLKEKAHESLMQAMIVQQIHQEEIKLLNQQFTQRQRMLEEITQNLNKRLHCMQKELQLLELNYHRHNLQISSQFSFDSINCKSELTSLDDSSIIQFQFIVLNNKNEEFLDQLKLDMLKESNKTPIKTQILMNKINKIYQAFGQQQKMARKNMIKILKENQQLREKVQNLQCRLQTVKKDSVFLQEHIKKLTEQKMKSEKRLRLTESQLKDAFRRDENFLSLKELILKDCSNLRPVESQQDFSSIQSCVLHSLQIQKSQVFLSPHTEAHMAADGEIFKKKSGSNTKSGQQS